MLVLRLKKRKLVRKNKFIISGGGTGGHIYPAISIANMIMKSIPNSEVRFVGCLLYTSPSPRDKRQSRMPSSA